MSSMKRGRKKLKKSNKGRKPKKPLSKEEITAKKNQKNMRETCRRVEINLHYELLYHSLGQNLVYNRAERVQLLRKAIVKMAELTAQVKLLSDQLKGSGINPINAPKFQLNTSQKLFMLVQRWARNENGKKCTRAKLKPVGIEILDDDGIVPITVPSDGSSIAGGMISAEDQDHVPFWASWETDTYAVVDKDAFEKACSQAMIAGWDGILGSKGARYISGLPAEAGLTIAQSYSNNKNSNNSRKRRRTNSIDMETDDIAFDDDESNDHSTVYSQKNENHDNNIHIYPPLVNFPDMSMRTGSNNNNSDSSSITSGEPPMKKQKLENGTKIISNNHDNQSITSNNRNNDSIQSYFSIPRSGQFGSNGLPLSVPFPAVNAQSIVLPMQTQRFLNLQTNNNICDPRNANQIDSQSLQSNFANKSDSQLQPIQPNFPVNMQVSFPQFLAFPPHPLSHQIQMNGHHSQHTNLVPVVTFPVCAQQLKHQHHIRTHSDGKLASAIHMNSDDNNQLNHNTTPPMQITKDDVLHKSNDNISISPETHSSHETRNSIVFTPARKPHSSAVSTDSNSTPELYQTKSTHSPKDLQTSIRLPDTQTPFLNNRTSRSVVTTPSLSNNYPSLHEWQDATSTSEGNLVLTSDDYNNVTDNSFHHHISIMNDMSVSQFQDASTSTHGQSNALKNSTFY